MVLQTSKFSLGGFKAILRLHPKRGIFITAKLSYPVEEGVQLQASPKVCLHDVHTSLTVKGLPISTPVTLRAEVLNDNGKKVSSCNINWA